MFDKIDERFKEIEKLMSGKEDSLTIVSKAYEFAKRAHGNQKRKDGSLYINHPVSCIDSCQLGF